MISDVYAMIEDYVAIQRRLIALLKERVGMDKDWEYLVDVPSSGTVVLDSRRWRFWKHGTGVTFSNDEGIRIHAHTGLSQRGDLFDAWRLTEYLDSRQQHTILVAGRNRRVNFQNMSELLCRLADAGKITRCPGMGETFHPAE